MFLNKKGLALIVISLLLSACGQKGPLYEPPPVQKNQQPADIEKKS